LPLSNGGSKRWSQSTRNAFCASENDPAALAFRNIHPVGKGHGLVTLRAYFI
jgi:hypothetical protein